MTGGNVTINQLPVAPSVSLTDVIPIQGSGSNQPTYGATVAQVLGSQNALSYGRIYISSAAATTLTNQNDFYKADGTTTLSPSPSQFDMPVNNRLRFTGTIVHHVFINCSISFQCSANNQTIGFQVYYYDHSAGTGSYIPGSFMARTSQSAGTVISISTLADASMDENDYIEIHINNSTSAGKTVTMEYMSLLIHGTVE